MNQAEDYLYDTRALPERVRARLYAMNKADWIAWGVLSSVGALCCYGGWTLAKIGLGVG